MKPEGYPLPWCDALGAPYWRINLSFCRTRKGWREWQSGKRMAAIIPVIDDILKEASDVAQSPC